MTNFPRPLAINYTCPQAVYITWNIYKETNIGRVRMKLQLILTVMKKFEVNTKYWLINLVGEFENLSR